MYTPQYIDGNIVQKSKIVNDNFESIRADLVDLYGRYYDFKSDISSFNSFGRQLVSDLFNLGDTMTTYSGQIDNLAYTGYRSIITMYEAEKIYTDTLLGEEESDESGAILAIHDNLTSTLGLPYMDITSLYSTVVRQSNSVTFIPTSNLSQYIDLIIRDEYKFTVINNSVDALFDNSQVFILRLNTSDVNTNSARVTIRLYMTNTSSSFNEVRILSYPNIDMGISDGTSEYDITNGINNVDLSPPYYIDITLDSDAYTVEGDGTRTFLFTIPVLQISNVTQNNYGMVGLYVPKKKESYIIDSFEIDSNVDISYSFKVYTSFDDMASDLNDIADSGVFPVNLLSDRYQGNILDKEYLYFLVNLYKENLDDIVYIKSFDIKWGE